MSIQRTTAKRQVAAARALLVTLHTRAMRPATAATDGSQIEDCIDRLSTTTEDLARETYQPTDFETMATPVNGGSNG